MKYFRFLLFENNVTVYCATKKILLHAVEILLKNMMRQIAKTCPKSYFAELCLKLQLSPADLIQALPKVYIGGNKIKLDRKALLKLLKKWRSL